MLLCLLLNNQSLNESGSVVDYVAILFDFILNLDLAELLIKSS